MWRDLVNRRDLRKAFQPTPRSVLGNRPRPPGRGDEDPDGARLSLHQDKLRVLGKEAD
jgi:hypothetical protein